MLHIIQNAIPKEKRESLLEEIKKINFFTKESDRRHWVGGLAGQIHENMPLNIITELQKLANIHIEDIGHIYNIKLQKLGPGWQVRVHRHLPNDRLPLHWDNQDNKTNKKIQVSLVFYWNDDFTGGDLVFPNLGIKYTPKAGDMVCLPPNELWSHEVQPVVTGIRYTTPIFYSEHEEN